MFFSKKEFLDIFLCDLELHAFEFNFFETKNANHPQCPGVCSTDCDWFGLPR